ncbi:MAG: hypothetical protein ACRDNO_22205 [Trebonia sp.]
MLIAPAELDEPAAPGLTVACRFIVPVNEFALDAVFAASRTWFSALAGVAEGDAAAPALEPEPGEALELELGEQPATAAATITPSPAAYNGRRPTLTCIKTSEA